MQKAVTSLVFLLFLTFFQPGHALAAETNEADAIRAAEIFLQALDAGDYEGGWQMTSPLHRARERREYFVPTVSAVRASFGPPVGRWIRYLRELDSAPMLPDGHYTYISFESAFERKNSGTEAIFVRLEEDGKWRVCDYRIN